MSQVKLTKTELRDQQHRLGQLRKYLPTLQLKKAMLQIEVNHAQLEIDELVSQFDAADNKIDEYCSLFSDKSASDLFSAVKIAEVRVGYENIAGVDIPLFQNILFEDATYSLFDTPLWMESAVGGVKGLLEVREKIKVAQQKKKALEKELREVSIRVNLFEKIMIPRAIGNIKKIKIFLGDQQLAAVSQAKVSKNKILLREKKEAEEEAR